MKYPFLNLNLKNKKAACSNATFSGGELSPLYEL